MSEVDGGCVVVSGVFPVGTVCSLFRVADEGVLRSAGGELVGSRTADAEGVVGFEGMEVGGCYFVTGYVNGRFEEVRCRGEEPGSVSGVLAQPSITVAPTVVGTQSETVAPDRPVERPDLPSGVPPAVASALAGGEASGQEVVPSESAGVAEGAGAPSEPAEKDASGDGQSSEEQAPSATGADPSVPGKSDVADSSGAAGADAGDSSPVLYVWISDLPQPTENVPDWQISREVQAPAEGIYAARALWLYTGELPVPDVFLNHWAVYGGDTEPVPAVEEVPAVAVGEQEPAPSPSARDQLLVQAVGLEVANAASLDDDELRQSITDKGSTPAA